MLAFSPAAASFSSFSQIFPFPFTVPPPFSFPASGSPASIAGSRCTNHEKLHKTKNKKQTGAHRLDDTAHDTKHDLAPREQPFAYATGTQKALQ